MTMSYQNYDAIAQICEALTDPSFQLLIDSCQLCLDVSLVLLQDDLQLLRMQSNRCSMSQTKRQF